MKLDLRPSATLVQTLWLISHDYKRKTTMNSSPTANKFTRNYSLPVDSYWPTPVPAGTKATRPKGS